MEIVVFELQDETRGLQLLFLLHDVLELLHDVLKVVLIHLVLYGHQILFGQAQL